MNDDLFAQVWGEPRPPGGQTEQKTEPGATVDGDISATIREHLADLRASQAEVAKLTDRLASIEQGLDRALQALVDLSQPRIVEKVKSLSRKSKPEVPTT